MSNLQEKILDPDTLASVCEKLHQKGRTIVHCHGVFDLLHIGHIRHFQAAKRMGEVLIVTLTADQYVNKGPNRPAFPAELRAEALAALECIDFVAVNQAQSAIAMIETIRPNKYVKGSDYRDRAVKNSGNLGREIAAVETFGGQLAFTDDIQFSSSVLINRHFSNFPPEIEKFLAIVRAELTPSKVSGYLDTLQELRVGVLASSSLDPMVSRELEELCSPVSILTSDREVEEGAYDFVVTTAELGLNIPYRGVWTGDAIELRGTAKADFSLSTDRLRIRVSNDTAEFPLTSGNTAPACVLVGSVLGYIAGGTSVCAAFFAFAARSSEANESGCVTRAKFMRCVEALLKH